ncbi:hypothetical protein HQP04_22745 [Rhodococcus fascians]|nr:hypothetical protein [Rhodococcus fascians]MDP9639711.1 hypothetical protein [Rhodococcus cercidiphylli]
MRQIETVIQQPTALVKGCRREVELKTRSEDAEPIDPHLDPAKKYVIERERVPLRGFDQ